MSFATVYNTLDALASAGLCAALSLAPGAARFDPNMGEHHHAVCDRCGLVRDVDAGDAPTRAPAAPGPAGFEVRVVERIYRGLCAACAGRAAHAGDARRRPAAERRSSASTAEARRPT